MGQGQEGMTPQKQNKILLACRPGDAPSLVVRMPRGIVVSQVAAGGFHAAARTVARLSPALLFCVPLGAARTLKRHRRTMEHSIAG